MTGATAIVLGAGLQGVLIALMLARRGVRVTLVDRRKAMMEGASLNHEGRIHLGLVYAMDRSLKTGLRMVEDALHFAPEIDRFCGRPLDWRALRSTATRYLVHRASHLSVSDLADHYDRIGKAVAQRLEDPRLSYLGQRPDRIFRPADVPCEADRDTIVGAFETVEACLDQPALHRSLAAAIAEAEGISLRLRHNVAEIDRTGPDRWAVICRAGTGEEVRLKGDMVVNCLWEERGLFDRHVGIDAGRAESLRLKYGVLVRSSALLERLGSVLVTHGAFGSIVTHPGSGTAFLSWYPACIKGMMPLGPMPDTWTAACETAAEGHAARAIWQDNIDGFLSVFPGFGRPEPVLVKAGVILAEGLRDIDRTDSRFHRRDDRPIRRAGSYVSVSTGKYTSAPRNAALLEADLFGKAGL